MTFKKGQVLFHEDGNATGIYFLTSGKVKISKLGLTGNERIIRLAKEGDILGFRTLFSSAIYPCSATAFEECSACFIPMDIFYKLIENNINLSRKLMTLLSKELSNADNNLSSDLSKPARARIATALLLIHEVYGFEEDNKTINAALKRTDIANIAGTTTETAVRLLSEYKEENIIEFNGKKIIILDHNKLEKIANLIY